MRALKITGIVASQGLAVAPALNYSLPKPADPNLKVPPGRIDPELAKFSKAHQSLANYYSEKCALLERQNLKDQAAILSIQHTMLMDREFIKNIKANIEKGYAAAAAVQRESNAKSALFAAMEDNYFRDRVYDVQDLCQRMFCELRGEEYKDLSVLSDEVVVIAYDIPPSVISTIDVDRVKGIVTVAGGKTSHTAILAANMNIPALVGCGDDLFQISDGELVFVNALTGEVETGFDQIRFQEIKRKIKTYQISQAGLHIYASQPTVTADGQKIALFANIMDAKANDQLLAVGAEGVGLFRTEFLYMDRPNLPSEEEQYQAYSSVAIKLAGLPVVIRTMDIGGDKNAECLGLEREENPFLGYRAIRISLDRVDLFMTQLKACLRASADGNVQIMFPMVSELNEIIKAKELLEEAKESLRKEGKRYNPHIKVGMMVEVPSAAIMADEFIKHVDFFSIGSNDLTQYTLAADRMNPKVAQLYNYFTPAVIRLINRTVVTANKAGKACGICGSMASEPLGIPLLLGLGLKELSVNPSALLQTRKLIAQIDLSVAERMALEVMQCNNAQDVVKIIRETFNNIYDEDLL